MLSLLLAATLAHASPCAADEAVVVSCAMKKKTLAVCAGPAGRATWLQYRFGTPGKPELVFPATTGQGTSAFTFEHRDLATGDSNSLTFTNGKTTYEVYTQSAKDGGGGVNISEGGKVIAALGCDNDPTENWDIAQAAFASSKSPSTSAATSSSTSSSKKTPQSGGPRPDPLAGKSQKDICNDDNLLLLKYPFDDLHANGFKKNCCVKGALGADDERCMLDWPFSDVPLCKDIDLWRNELFALYGYTFKEPKFQSYFDAQDWYQPRSDFDAAWLPAVAQKNATRLKALVKDKLCISDNDAAEAGVPTASLQACRTAGEQGSLALQKQFAGRIDGVEQASMAEAITEQCQASWTEESARCVAKGPKGCPLTETQKKALWSALRAIHPDVHE